MSACCDTSGHTHTGIDKLFWGSLIVITGGIAAHFFCTVFDISAPVIHHFGTSILDLIHAM